MYNRYIRNDMGQYERIPTQETPPPGGPPPPDGGPYGPPPPPPRGDGRRGFLSGILNKLKLDNLDTGDLLLLLIILLLFKDGEDEELLIALGLLLIL